MSQDFNKQLEQLRKDLKVVTDNQAKIYNKIDEFKNSVKAIEKNSDYLLSSLQTIMTVYNENKDGISEVVKTLQNQLKNGEQPIITADN